MKGLSLPDYVTATGITGIAFDQYYLSDGTVAASDQLTTEQLQAVAKWHFVPHYDSEPFSKPGKVLDASEFNQIADTSSEAVEGAIASLRRSGMVKTAELIEATSNE